MKLDRTHYEATLQVLINKDFSAINTLKEALDLASQSKLPIMDDQKWFELGMVNSEYYRRLYMQAIEEATP